MIKSPSVAKPLTFALLAALGVSSLVLAAHSRSGLPEKYQDLSALGKRQILWNNILRSEYPAGSSLPNEPANRLEFFTKLLSTTFLNVTFFNVSDEMPIGRPRLIHTYGSVALVRFEPLPGHPYTGMFREGSVGLARLSLASPDSFIPGMGLKLLIDGKPSTNFQVMNSLDSQGDNHDFFAHPFTNVIPPASSAAVRAAGALGFGRTVRAMVNGPRDEFTLPVEESSAITPKGEAVADWVAPFQLSFVPSADVAGRFAPNAREDMRLQLATLPEGATLYEVSARDEGGKFVAIGKLVLESRFVASSYGDQSLFFQHQRRLPAR